MSARSDRLVAGLATLALAAAACMPDRPVPSLEEPATYVGSEACARCHEPETELWIGSHHDLAMQAATDSTVLGDFQNATAQWGDVTSTFFRREGGFFVRTDGPDGELADFEIEYAFGVEPLQQYLIPFPDGRLQTLGLIWDTHPEEEGGQRWTEVYPGETIPHDDVLHWTGPLQNWNVRCAECHSTDVRRNWSTDSLRYDTTWFEINVGCEACHGPGSRHAAWAELPEEVRKGTDPEMAVDFTDPGGGIWEYTPGDAIAHRTAPRETRVDLETCAVCHSRRSPIAAGPVPGEQLENTHRLQLLREGLYHADGQILDEVYVYGSFLQSRMHAAGVTCMDCHDAHSTRRRLPGDLVCSKCHHPDVYAKPEHHFHKPDTKGASCIACHMLGRVYMAVDERQDHSFRVPRPDLTLKIGTPSTCTDCHADSSAWSAAEIEKRFGPPEPHWGEAIAAGRTWSREAPAALRAVAANDTLPGIVRATALQLLGERLGPRSLQVVEAVIDDPDPLVRRSALEALSGADPGTRIRLAARRLDDPLLSVRLEATSQLVDIPVRELSTRVAAALVPAIKEYRQSQEHNADLPEAWLNLAWLHSVRGQTTEAEEAYKTALRISPLAVRVYVNYADFCRTQQRDVEAEEILRSALRIAPDDPDVLHALGLRLVRKGRREEALESLGRAAVLGESVPRYAYVHAIALQDAGRVDEALDVLREGHERFPGQPDFLAALVVLNRDAGREAAAARWAHRLEGVRAGL